MISISEIVLILSNIATMLALIIGGVWAIHRYRLYREASSNPQIKINYEILEYNDNNKLLVLTILVRNIGKVVVEAEKITYSIFLLPKNLPIAGKPQLNVQKILINNSDLIYDANPSEIGVIKYMIEPGDEYEELLSLVTPSKSLMLLDIYFQSKQGDKFRVYKIIKS